jgi:phenylalanyl-tRNA synthetase beta chain
LNLRRSDRNIFVLEPDEHFEFKIQKEFKKNVFCVGGKLSVELLKKYDIPQEVFLFDINLDLLRTLPQITRKYSAVLKYPKVKRDFAFVLDKSVNYVSVIKAIRSGSSSLLKNIKLFDIFESESLGEGKKSMAFELEYYVENKTLTEEEVEKDFWNAIDSVRNKLNAQLRG